jgi:hypothetical protein
MGHFAELNEDNVVLRVVKACNQDIANNGGEQSEQAAEHFKSITPLSNEGVRWVQTSYNNNFRKQFAGLSMIYDENKDKFIAPKPYPSWILDSNDDWKTPISEPNTMLVNGVDTIFFVYWNESLIRWEGKDLNKEVYSWNPSLYWEKL